MNAQTVSPRDFAIHWSPFIYQATHNNYDIPTNWDFDEDWIGDNNWENAFYWINNFRTYIYYTFQETDNHYFITYAFFHPRDTKQLSPHENDWEGARVTIEKDGSQYGWLIRLETFHHGNLSTTTAPEIINGSHPAVWVEERGHGVYISNNRPAEFGGGEIFPGDCGGLGIWYAGRGAETPEHCNDRDVSMDLIAFEDRLWPDRFWGPGGPYADTANYVSGAYFGKRFKDDDGCRSKPPWSWDFSPDGYWFMNPRDWLGLSGNYIYNPFLNDTRSAVVGSCP